jgi:hypothetical protein
MVAFDQVEGSSKSQVNADASKALLQDAQMNLARYHYHSNSPDPADRLLNYDLCGQPGGAGPCPRGINPYAPQGQRTPALSTRLALSEEF